MTGRWNVYDRARLVLLDRGWTQGDLSDHTGAVDILGACLTADGASIADAKGRGNIEDADLARHAAVLAPLINDPRGYTDVEVVTLWNDSADRTVDDVDRVLAEAADRQPDRDREPTLTHEVDLSALSWSQLTALETVLASVHRMLLGLPTDDTAAAVQLFGLATLANREMQRRNPARHGAWLEQHVSDAEKHQVTGVPA